MSVKHLGVMQEEKAWWAGEGFQRAQRWVPHNSNKEMAWLQMGRSWGGGKNCFKTELMENTVLHNRRFLSDQKPEAWIVWSDI